MLEFGDLPEPVMNFVSYKLNIQNRSRKTVYEYTLDLRAFFTYTMRKKLALNSDTQFDFSKLTLSDVASVTTENIYEYLLHAAEENNNSAASRARKLSAIRSFYKYMTVKAHALENDPSKDIESPKLNKSLPKFLSLDESKALLETVSQKGGRTRARDFAIITLFLNCGMRLSELSGMSLSDVTEDLSSVRVTGKGSKQRVLYLNSACREALGEYLSVRGSLACNDKNALWVSSQGRRMYNKTVQYTVMKYLKLAGLENKHYSTHKLRHTAATLMYGTGKVDVRVLKDILGHEQLNTTQIYTHVSDAQMQSAAEQNPLSSVHIKKNSF